MALRNRKLPRHILVIRNSAMGDVAMVPHALRALREAYPDVRVTVLTRPLFKPFFAGLDVDFLEVDYAGRHKGVLGLLRLAGEARRRGSGRRGRHARGVAFAHRRPAAPAARNAGGAHRQGAYREVVPAGVYESGRLAARNIPSSVIATYCAVWDSSSTIRSRPCEREHRPSPMGEKDGVWIGFAPFLGAAGQDLSRTLAPRRSPAAGRYDRVFIHSGGGAEAEFARRWSAIIPMSRRFADGFDCGRARPDRQSRLRRVDGFAGHAFGFTRGDARGVGMGCDASRSGILRVRLRSARHRAGRYGVPPVLGLRK